MINMIVAGSLGKDAVVNTVNGKTVINFSVAHTEKWKDAQGNQQEKTTWVECSKWVKSSGIAPYLKKGTPVVVSGSPSVKPYQANDGSAKANLCLNVYEIQLMGKSTQSETNETEVVNEGIDDIPF